jgi:hypothetical protein
MALKALRFNEVLEASGENKPIRSGGFEDRGTGDHGKIGGDSGHRKDRVRASVREREGKMTSRSSICRVRHGTQ